MKKTLFILVSLALFGCASTVKSPPEVYKDPSVEKIKTVFHSPELGIRSTAEIGENLYSKFYYTPSNTYEVHIDRDVVLSTSKDRQYGWLVLGVIGVGIMELTADTDNEEIVKGHKHLLSYWPEYNYRMLCGSNNTCLVDTNGDGVFTSQLNYPDHELNPLDSGIPYALKKTPPRYEQDDFKYVALYQGKAGNKIKISFREFKGDMARPAFTQDIEYELDENGEAIIGFKGLRIKVHQATNLNIDYTVINDYK
ncbi:hypothetical protein O1D25_001489 [Vibrio cholerae]|nr:hypothetical protein [Vibrio cholerae]EKF9848563.1 hypothetical protein [Vibrio cholerae]